MTAAITAAPAGHIERRRCGRPYPKYRVQLGYNGYFGNYSTTPTSVMNITNGVPASLSDRGWVSLTFKTTF